MNILNTFSADGFVDGCCAAILRIYRLWRNLLWRFRAWLILKNHFSTSTLTRIDFVGKHIKTNNIQRQNNDQRFTQFFIAIHIQTKRPYHQFKDIEISELIIHFTEIHRYLSYVVNQNKRLQNSNGILFISISDDIAFEDCYYLGLVPRKWPKPVTF